MDIRELKLGTKLDLELINNLGEKIGQTYVSQVIDILDAGNIVIAAPIHEARLMLITPGTKVRLVFLHDRYGLLSFRGSITGREKKDNIIALNTKIDGDYEKIQRRKYFRLDCTLDAGYRLCPEDGSKQDGKNDPKPAYKKTLAKNISGCGACIVIEEELSKNSLVELVIYLNKDTSVKVVCKVVRCSKLEATKLKKFELGLYFNEISQKDQDAIIKYVFDQQRILLKNNIFEK